MKTKKRLKRIETLLDKLIDEVASMRDPIFIPNADTTEERLAEHNADTTEEPTTKYKVGDVVKIKSLEWYKAGENIEAFVRYMSAYCGKMATIKSASDGRYRLDIDESHWRWSDWMFEDEFKADIEITWRKYI